MSNRYGCIGEHLKHSFSKEIHNALADYTYDIIEIPREKLEEFATHADFAAINVTIPYKELIIPYLYEIDEHAREIGAVNTVVNRNGKLYGYNTDFYGMKSLLEYANISVNGKKVAILGSGGTAKTAFAVTKALGANEILSVSRNKRSGVITYDELYANHDDTQIIINTTPVGMFPDIYSSPVDISKFKNLCGVMDAIYNPLSSALILKAKEMGIPACGGLYMLVTQAIRASEIFLNTEYPKTESKRIFEKIQNEKQNVVLIGMPSSGKSTIGKIISEKLGRTFIDTDSLIQEKSGMEIPDIFSTLGESAFRKMECDVIAEVSKSCNTVIATGGGVILNKENVFNLRKNGKIYFIDRPLAELIPTDDRPLSQDADALKSLYEKRYNIYINACDERILNTESPESVANKIIGEFSK